ncbi:ATP-dependent DNA helicase [Roseomonas sp. NAR14]|uniref:ATP-dependent DNA helicase n=1 Tax=Roseomonas acroporae TaxID=2937791 RepID=A0A9X1YD63_9PROT|nr:ATP-dependent DNA helicase [Roseomonas acroporae]MCK8787971.1 ATP-dependent DNA helicase [Roseomonas acroporae]
MPRPPRAARPSASAPPGAPRLLLPAAPALVAGHGRAALLTEEGELETLTAEAAAERLRHLPPPLLVHATATARRLGIPRPRGACDLLELFAFAMPAQPAAPTPRGLALALGCDAPRDDEAAVALLPELATRLLRHLALTREGRLGQEAARLAARMGQAGWPWAEPVLAALGWPEAPNLPPGADPLRVWRLLPEWEETAPPPPPASLGVAPAESRARLAAMLGEGAEQRPSQADYASAAAAAFAPRDMAGAPAMVLAEAGTGTGKTLGYIAPASLWAERNGAPVWISTYTRNLQRQIDGELARVYPDPEERRRRVVVRKGRENYLCLLNYEEVLSAAPPGMAVPLGLVARWAVATRDGDILAGDFPGWLVELFGPAAILPLADRRGECIHSACPHWKTCFVEHSIRRARTATLVVANHALVMVQAALGGDDSGEESRPPRYVFDEGHHLFDAADSAFSAELGGAEAAELRRWLLGAEGGRSRARGLRRRIEELATERPELLAPLDAALQAARALPAAGWMTRLVEDLPEEAYGEGDGPDGHPYPKQAHPAGQEEAEAASPRRQPAVAHANPAEAFLRVVRRQVLARTARDDGYDLECDLHPQLAELASAATTLARALYRIEEPLARLRERLAARLDEEAEEMELGERIRIEAACRGIERRALIPLRAWRDMLDGLAAPPPEPGSRPAAVDWLALHRREGRDVDAAMHRHALDPTIPFATAVAAPAHGLLVTSATLRDIVRGEAASGGGGAGEGTPDSAAEAGAESVEASWRAAEARTGASHLPRPAIRAAVPSPFDYAAATRAFVVTDVARENTQQVAAAMRALFLAAGGGGLGLFTAIRRLREVHRRIAPALEQAGIPLYAQHVDAMDNATLVDVFRAEEESCLLGTDAMRDGVDVPGRSLRLLVFDRVPWPRPSILHRERRLHLSEGRPKDYDDALARHRLRQAFGRLIRRADDRGVFVLLDRSCPSRLLAGLPAGVETRRVGLAEAVAATREFLSMP